MANNFKKYKKAKLTLMKLTLQFYSTSFTVEEAGIYKIKYDERDIPNELGYIDCVSHMYSPEGLYIWKTLGLKKPIYSFHEIWDILDKIKYEQESKEEDYYRKYLEICMINLSMIREYYSYRINAKEAKRIGLIYEEIDEMDGSVDCIDHLYESAGESAWNLFGFDKEIITKSIVYKKEEEIRRKLLRIDL